MAPIFMLIKKGVVQKIQIYCGVLKTKIAWSDTCVFPLQHPQISRDFGSFSNFLEKLGTSFGIIFDIMYYIIRFIFPVLSRGSQLIIHYYPPKKTENSQLSEYSSDPKLRT